MRFGHLSHPNSLPFNLSFAFVLVNPLSARLAFVLSLTCGLLIFFIVCISGSAPLTFPFPLSSSSSPRFCSAELSRSDSQSVFLSPSPSHPLSRSPSLVSAPPLSLVRVFYIFTIITNSTHQIITPILAHTSIPAERSLTYNFTTFAQVASHAGMTRWRPVSKPR